MRLRDRRSPTLKTSLYIFLKERAEQVLYIYPRNWSVARVKLKIIFRDSLFRCYFSTSVFTRDSPLNGEYRNIFLTIVRFFDSKDQFFSFFFFSVSKFSLILLFFFFKTRSVLVNGDSPVQRKVSMIRQWNLNQDRRGEYGEEEKEFLSGDKTSGQPLRIHDNPCLGKF